MTPGQLSALLAVHARVNDPDAAGKPARKAGTAADLDRLSALAG